VLSSELSEGLAAVAICKVVAFQAEHQEWGVRLQSLICAAAQHHHIQVVVQKQRPSIARFKLVGDDRLHQNNNEAKVLECHTSL